MKKKTKEPSLLRQLIEAYIERWRAHKAMRILSKQAWSVEFLQSLLVRASRVLSQQLQLTVTGPDGTSFTVTTPSESALGPNFRDDSVFNHLDDEIKVKNFIDSLQRAK